MAGLFCCVMVRTGINTTTEGICAEQVASLMKRSVLIVTRNPTELWVEEHRL
jgi:hypothetical protein